MQVDVYAFACVIFETLCNADQWPWKGTQVGDIHRLVTAGRRPPFLSGSADDTEGGELTALMNKAWAQDASARPSFAQIEEDLKRVFRIVKGGAVTRFRRLSGAEVSGRRPCARCCVFVLTRKISLACRTATSRRTTSSEHRNQETSLCGRGSSTWP